jgi:hypothetical protein
MRAESMKREGKNLSFDIDKYWSHECHENERIKRDI